MPIKLIIHTFHSHHNKDISNIHNDIHFLNIHTVLETVLLVVSELKLTKPCPHKRLTKENLLFTELQHFIRGGHPHSLGRQFS